MRAHAKVHKNEMNCILKEQVTFSEVTYRIQVPIGFVMLHVALVFLETLRFHITPCKSYITSLGLAVSLRQEILNSFRSCEAPDIPLF